MVVISSTVGENALCWWDGRKKRNIRMLGRLTHLLAALDRYRRRRIAEDNRACVGRTLLSAVLCGPLCPLWFRLVISTTEDTEDHRGKSRSPCRSLTLSSGNPHNPGCD